MLPTWGDVSLTNRSSSEGELVGIGGSADIETLGESIGAIGQMFLSAHSRRASNDGCEGELDVNVWVV